MLAILATLLLRLTGWTLNSYTPPEKKYLLIAGPHTAWADGFWMVFAGAAFRIRPSFLVKQTYIKGLFGRAVLAAGGIPVLAGAGANKVQATIDFINEKESVALLLAPAGTRRKVDRWRSGFYHIGCTTNLPVYMSYLDYGKRRLGVHPEPIILTGNVTADMDKIRAFYADKRGKVPENESVIRLKEEGDNN